MPEPDSSPWIDVLNDEDLAFLKRFLLASGSLKAVAAAYGISYPTVRLRLDRLIQKVEVAEQTARMRPFERRLRLLHAEGKIGLDALKSLLAAYKQDLEQSNEVPRDA